MARHGALALVLCCFALTLGDEARGAKGDPPPAQAFAPVRLYPLPPQVRTQCRLAKAIALCPRRLPRPTIPARRGSPLPQLVAEHFRYRDGGGIVVQVSFHYGAGWEPDSGPDWRLHLWRNRPCCFLHFELYHRLTGPRLVPTGARPATLGGKRGLLVDAAGYGMACGARARGVYFCNHTRFAWRQSGTWYIATLHYFGYRETRALLGRLIRELGPVM